MTFAGRPRPTSRLSAFADTHAVVPPTPIASASRGRLRASARTADTGTVPNVPYCIGSQTAGKAGSREVVHGPERHDLGPGDRSSRERRRPDEGADAEGKTGEISCRPGHLGPA